jgi:putative long chain acyl-CoA synthase
LGTIALVTDPNDPSAPRPERPRRKRTRRRASGLTQAMSRVSKGAENALELMRLGRLGTPYIAPFDVVREERVFRLRHYRAATPLDARLCPALLVPPLMVTSEVYDIAPDLSAVQMLMRAGIDVWVVDFGAPEREAGGMERTLDDHVRAVSTCIDEIIAHTKKEVHVLGYSQGGMFAYQVAAWRSALAREAKPRGTADDHRGGIRSLVTFGSPVDIRRNLPVPAELAGRIIAGARVAIERPLQAIEGLPGFFTSTGFKLLSFRKEVQQLAEFVTNLHDREALEKRESRRRFLGGEGFVAWPGPAFRTFVDEFIVHNRLASGGFVIDGRTVTLAEVIAPILFFVGTNDEIARAPSVRAIGRAAPLAEQHEIPVRAGHFGIVVGSKASSVTWPNVIGWIQWKDGVAEMPGIFRKVEARPADPDDDDAMGELDDVDVDVDVFVDILESAAEAAMRRAGAIAKNAGRFVDNLRWQVPRLSRLRKIEPGTKISMAKVLSEQAAAIPENTFFLWKGRAFPYKDADRRVTNVAKGLIACGVKPGTKVGVLMEARPSYLSMVCALNRMGAVAVLLSPDSTRVTLDQAIAAAGIEMFVADPENALRARTAFRGKVLVLGGGPPSAERPPLPEGVVDMEAIDPDSVIVPASIELDGGRASDLAMIIFTAGRTKGGETVRPARITNRRWAFSALGAAAGCALTSDDTVYCCLPLTHAAGMLVAVGGALIGGSRLALSKHFDEAQFWPDVHRYGATIVFYAGEMLRALVDADPSVLDATYPVRLFAGSGMRRSVWERLRLRFPRAQVLEFYASTEGNAVLANASGTKIGSLGKALPGSADLALLGWDFAREDYKRDEQKALMVAGIGEPGVLVARVDASAMAGFDGFEGEKQEKERAILRGVFDPGDAWFVTGDLVRRDEDGDHWLVDRLSDVVRSDQGPVPTIAVEDALETCRNVRTAVCYALARTKGAQVLTATIIARDGALDPATFTEDVVAKLPIPKRPRLVRVVKAIPLTDGYRPKKSALKEQGALVGAGETLLVYDEKTEKYAVATSEAIAALGIAGGRAEEVRA